MATPIRMTHRGETAALLLAALGVFWAVSGGFAADPVRTAVQTGTPRRVIAADSSRQTLAAIARALNPAEVRQRLADAPDEAALLDALRPSGAGA